MNKEKQRISIAEFCDFKELTGDPWRGGAWMSPRFKSIRHFMLNGEPAIHKDALPDYLNDLNAMHEAVCRLSDTDLDIYAKHLCKIMLRTVEVPECEHTATRLLIGALKATAEQQAEALLKTIRKWEDE